MSDDDDQNKTIIVRRPASGEAPAAAPAAAKETAAPAPKPAETPFIKTPAGIITLVVVVVIAVFAAIKLTGK